MLRKMIAFFLSICILLSAIPLPSYASQEETPEALSGETDQAREETALETGETAEPGTEETAPAEGASSPEETETVTEETIPATEPAVPEETEPAMEETEPVVEETAESAEPAAPEEAVTETTEPEMELEPDMQVYAGEIVSGTLGENQTWTLDAAGVLTISGTGDIPDFHFEDVPWVEYTSAVETVVIASGITGIGKWTFYDHSNLKRAEIADSVTWIGESAFRSCGLESLVIPSGITSIGDYAFWRCDDLTDIYITDVEAWLNIAYENDSGHILNANSKKKNLYLNGERIEKLVIPETITRIPDYAFAYCGSLTDVNIPEGVTSIGESAFQYCGLADIEIPSTVTNIGCDAFYGNEALAKIFITDLRAWLDISYDDTYSCPMTANDKQDKLYLNGELITHLVIPEGATRIPDFAFAYCTSLTGVEIPDSVTRIGESAFRESGLRSIHLPASITSIGAYAFWENYDLEKIFITDLEDWLNISYDDSRGNPMAANSKVNKLYLNGEPVKELVIPEGVTRIPDYAFAYCESLTGIEIPATVTDIGVRAFVGCRGLEQVEMPDSVVRIGEYAFSDCTGLTGILLSDNITCIEQYTFYNCTKLKRVALPASATETGHDAFGNCASLTEVTIPEGFLTLGSYTFGNCAALKDVVLPSTLQQIKHNAFSNCDSLTDIEIPENVTSLDESAFDNCDNLARIRVSEGNAQYCSDSEGIVYNADQTRLILVPPAISGACTIPGTVAEIPGHAFFQCVRLESVTVSQGVRVIGAGAFSSCTGLETVSIGDSVEEIGEGAFRGCIKLEQVDLPAGLIALREDLFYDCEGLREITVPAGVRRIGDSAFGYCEELKLVTIPDSVTEIESYAFSGCDNLTDVYYTGTEAQWDSILIQKRNDPLALADYHWQSHGIHAFSRMQTLPGCVTMGWTEYSCSCGAGYLADWQDPLWHDYDSTVTGDGYLVYTCSVCGDSYTSDVPGNTPAQGYNGGAHNYSGYASRWASVTESYLMANPNGTYTRVQSIGRHVHIERYDQNLELLSHKELNFELPIFGGYYSNGSNHFLVFGQTNYKEDDRQEVFRVVKYSSDWQRLGSTHLYGCNTTGPFDAGSLQMASVGDTLYVRTCHEMYKSNDGLNHQSNYMFAVRISDMTLLNTGNMAYVSHSFNQYIAVDGQDVILADHGDAYPRAIQLARNSGEKVSVLNIIGETGDNATGAALGGLGVSGTHYLIAGNSVKQDGSVSIYGGQRNIFLTATAKNNFNEGGTTLRWLTNYGEDDSVSVSNPHLVKISDSKFCLLWMEAGVLRYLFTDNTGEPITRIFENEMGWLSDCAPVYTGGKILWYVCDYLEMNFYAISPEAPETVEIKNIVDHWPKLTVAHVRTSGKPKLSWTAVAGAAEYGVFRSETMSGEYEYLGSTDQTSYTDKTAQAGKVYYYGMAAYEEYGYTILETKPARVVCKLPCPKIKLSNDARTGKPQISWDAVAGAAAYEVYRSASQDTGFELLASVTETAYGDTTALGGETYYYKVLAAAALEEANSGDSDVKKGICKLSVPSVTLENLPDSGKILVSWEPVEGASAYRVYRATGKSGSYKLLAETGETEVEDTAATAGKTYYYKVKAIAEEESTASEYSEVNALTCRLKKPGLTVSHNENQDPVLEWEKIPGAKKYELWYAQEKDGSYTLLAATTGVSYTHSDAVSGEARYYKVKALGTSAEGDSAFSEPVYGFRTDRWWETNTLVLEDPELRAAPAVWVDGVEYGVRSEGNICYVALPEGNARTLVVYGWNHLDGADPHTRYPTAMKVWLLENRDGIYNAVRAKNLDDLLQYSGMSVRITGKRGIRMITGMDKAVREALLGDGLAGFTLVEYGTAAAWADSLGKGNALLLGQSHTKSNYAYRRGELDAVFQDTGSRILYTNVLVDFNLEQCARDIVLRPYIILEDAQGRQLTLYGGQLVRSIGYVAWQNRDVFEPGTEGYDFLREIIDYVYPEGEN